MCVVSLNLPVKYQAGFGSFAKLCFCLKNSSCIKYVKKMRKVQHIMIIPLLFY